MKILKRNIQFSKDAEADIAYWYKKDKKILKRIYSLVDELAKTPFTGKGKPEPLRYLYSGCWSRRINREHRIVYQVTDKTIRILLCRYHY